MKDTVAITGANRGIGLSLARRFLEAGAHVVATCRNPEASRELEALADGNLDVYQVELTDGESISRFCSDVSGSVIDVLINNAGVMGGDHQGIDDMDYRAWLYAFEVNTLAPFRLATALLPNLRRAKRPRIVTLSSQMGSLSREGTGSYAYRSSKAAVNKTMRALAVQLRREGVVVCPVHPGWVRTDMGGANADISAEESAEGLFDLVTSLTLAHSGRFWTWDGREHPW